MTERDTMKFNKLATVDYCGLVGPSKNKILELSTLAPSLVDNDPTSDDEIITRIGDADCVLVSWRTKLTAAVLNACPSIKYVGMCCSLYDEKAANVDIAEGRKLGITVKGVKDYGDDGTLEFIFSQLIHLGKGLGPQKWREGQDELTSKTIGIVGMGFLGKMVARAALMFKMKVYYNSRTRKPEMDELGCTFLPLDDMLPRCDVVTLHLPRNLCLFHDKEFGAMKKDAIFVNTSLGQPFDGDALFKWVGAQSGNFALLDLPGSGQVTKDCAKYPNILLYPKPSGFTAEAQVRLTDKVYENMVNYLAGK